MCAHVRIVENTLKIQQHIDAMCTYIYIYMCVCIKMLERSMSIYIQLYYTIYGDGSKPWHLVNIKIAGKWMFIPLKMVLIGIDPYPYIYTIPVRCCHFTLCFQGSQTSAASGLLQVHITGPLVSTHTKPSLVFSSGQLLVLIKPVSQRMSRKSRKLTP